MEENEIEQKDPSKLKSLNAKLLDPKSQKLLDEKEKKDLSPPVPITLSRKVRWIIFAIFIYFTIVIELDQGTLSSSTDSISKDIELNDNELGGLGSMIFLGKSLGCLLFFSLINKLNRKYMLLVTSLLLILSLILTTQTKNLTLLYISRIIAGLTQSYVSIYFPVWADQFGVHKYKSLIMTCHHLASSMGSLLGYVIGVWLGWKLGFYLQSILIVIPNILLIFISNKFFSISLMPIKSKMKLLEKPEDKDKEKTKENKETDKIEKEIKNIEPIVLDDASEKEKPKEENKEQEEDKDKLIEEEKKEEKEGEINLEDDISLFEDIQKRGDNKSTGSILPQIKAIIKSPLFILINITLCSIYAIVAAVQFWINDYLQYGLKIEDPQTRFIMFGVVVVTAVPAGMVVGGIFLTKVGGYESEKAIYIPLIFSLIVTIFANLAPLSSNAYVFLPLFWLYFFSGSAVIPAANSLSLVSVEKKYAGAASSTNILLCNVLGRFPGPNLYAAFKSLIDDNSSRIPMLMLLNLSFIGFVAVLIALKFNKQKFIKLREEMLKEEKEKEEKEKGEEKNNKDNNNNNINDIGEEAEILIVDENYKKENNNEKKEIINDDNNNNVNNNEINKEDKNEEDKDAKLKEKEGKEKIEEDKKEIEEDKKEIEEDKNKIEEKEGEENKEGGEEIVY